MNSPINTEESMEIGMRMKKKREALGLTCAQLARKAGVSQALVTQLEHGKYPHLKGKKVVAVKRVLKVRFRGEKPSKARMSPVRNRVVPADAALLAAVKAMHLEVSRLGRAISKLTAKVGVPDRMIRDSKPEPTTPAPESLAA